ncbi:LRR receptor-like kinase [Medicago truncatula]|nr:LRR receptor-like kinase [Medicago truncatula]
MACLASNSENITTDQSALLAFKSLITSDPYDMLTNNWSTSSSVCNWVGVVCDERHGRVYSLILQNMRLRGNISPNLGNLSFLVTLDLKNNSFGGQLPKELFRLRRLKFLHISYNEFEGGIPVVLGDLSQLQYLYLGVNNFSGIIPQSIGNLQRLKELDTSYNRLSGPIPQSISNMSSLELLNLYSNYFSGKIPSLNKMTSLRVVELANNNLNGRLPNDFFNQLPQLEDLTLTDNQFEGSIPRSIGNCTSLINLDLQSNFFTGSILEEIGYLDKLELLVLHNNSFSGAIPSKIFNMSSLTGLSLGINHLSRIIPSNMGYSLPSLQYLHLYGNNFTGNIPNSIFNSSNLIEFRLGGNAFSGTLPNFVGNLRFLKIFDTFHNNFTIEDSHQFFTSLSNCRNLKFLDLSRNHILPNLPKSIGNLTAEFFWAASCGIDGNIPLEVGNMSNLLRFSLSVNNITGPIPSTFKGLQKLQILNLSSNGLQGSFIEEFCEMKSLGDLYLEKNKLSGVLPTCMGNMTSLIRIHVGSNNLNSKIPLSLWSLRDILEINFSSNSLSGNLPPQIENLRAIILLDLSRNHISSNIPTTINSLITLQILSLAENELNGSIPKLLGQMAGLISLDLSQNMLTSVIPKSLESLLYLENINLSYNRLEGEIPDGGSFKKFTAQSFLHNGVLCGNPRLQVPPCGKEDKKMSMAKMIILKCILPIVVSAILIVAFIICFRIKRKNVENTLERELSVLGATRRISYYELVEATNGFNESKLLGRGSFGSVYQGMLPDGEMIAVKVIDSEAKSTSFDAECNVMRNLRHRNLVKIISSCSNHDFKALVLEFMSNGSVDDWLYSDNYCLNFLHRLNIMIDVASALEYLHHGSSIPVVHCDLKPSNVLLDENMVAHVSDFGIAKLMDEGQSKTHTQTLATIGYLAPEYGSKGIVSVKGDVYSYGIMLMEIFTRRKPTDDMFAAELSLKTWISGSLPNAIMEVLDSNLVQLNGDEIDLSFHMSSIFSLSLNCCEDSPEARINMEDVIASLIKIKTLVLGENWVKL